MNVLQEADKLVHGPRGKDYGHPLDDFACTAKMWTAFLRRRYGPRASELRAEDVGLMMIAVKLSREAGVHKSDNLVDTAGYAETVNMVIEERAQREELRETFHPMETV